jgi:hypothetical protein
MILVIFFYSSSLTVLSMASRTTAAITTMMLPLLALAFLLLPATAFQAPLTTQRPTTSYNYAITADPQPLSSFEDCMRDLIRKQDQEKGRAAASAPNKKNQRRVFGPRPSFLKQVSTEQEYKTVVADEAERISMVRFCSASCHSCNGGNSRL